MEIFDFKNFLNADLLKNSERGIKIIAIIGAGPIGCYLGYLLAKNHKDVIIFEEHPVTGSPVSCTGLVSREITKFISTKNEFIINKLNSANIYSKHNRISIKIDEFVLNRTRFDQYLAKKAQKAGAEIILNHKFIDYKGGFIILKDLKHNCTIKLKPEAVIGADGPLSATAKANNLFKKRQFYIGMQARIKGNFNPDSHEVYLGSICPDFLAWIVPESENTAIIGLASKTNTLNLFKNFLKIKKISQKNIISKQAGLIPIHNPKIKVQKNNIYLIGDAAAQVKATTGGGIIPGLKAAKILANCIINNKNYQKALKPLKIELWFHEKARIALSKFSDRDYNKLLELIKGQKTNKIISSNLKDNFAGLIAKLMVTQPKLLRHVTARDFIIGFIYTFFLFKRYKSKHPKLF